MVSRTRFRNRAHAGTALAQRLERYSCAKDTIVVGLARGGVAVAAALAETLCLTCEVFVSRKLSLPEDQKRALGAVTETGFVFIDEAVLLTEPRLPRDLRRYIEEELQLRESDVDRRCACYRGGRTIMDFRDQTVIVVDEGTFTGTTFVAAIQSFRMMKARQVVGALPVAPRHVVRQIRRLTDELVVLFAPRKIEDLGSYYDEFDEVKDEEIVTCLASHGKTIDEGSVDKTAA